MRWRSNVDPAVRELERIAKASGVPEDMQRWFRRRQQAGGRDAFRAVLEERDWLWNVERPRIEAAYKEAHAKIDEAAMKALRNLHKRIGRSKRRDLLSLEGWARDVVGDDVVDRVLAPYNAERERVTSFWFGIRDQVRERNRELAEARLDAALSSEFYEGDEELEYRFHRTSTHSSVGYGADGYARRGAEDDVKFLEHMELEARMEQDPGEPWGPGGPPRSPFIRGVGAYAWIRPGQGWRSFVRVKEPLDVLILQARQEAWKDRDWAGYLETILGIPRR